MNSIHFVSPLLNHNGAIFKLWVAPKKLKGNKNTFYDTDAIIDTGATFSAIDINFADELKIPITGQRSVILADGKEYILPIYNIHVVFSTEHKVIFNSRASGMDLSSISSEDIKIGIIIGRDILSNCIFNYNGLENTFSLQF